MDGILNGTDEPDCNWTELKELKSPIYDDDDGSFERKDSSSESTLYGRRMVMTTLQRSRTIHIYASLSKELQM